MNNLEKLYELKKRLEKDLKEIEIDQLNIETEITEKRNISWNKMFDDLYAFKKYSRYIDTGLEMYKGETLGFDIRNDGISVISWSHFYSNGKKRVEPYRDTYFFTITRDKPFETNSHYAEWMKYVLKAIENWDEIAQEIERRLSKRLESEIKEKIFKSEQRQMELESNLKAISK